MCFCWRIDRQDGVIMGFTDHDVDLTFDSVTYQRTTSFSASAMENQLGLAVSNLDVMGALSSDSITEDDLESGRYDGALLTIYLVNWQEVTQRVVIMKGPLGQVTIGDLAYQAELRSLGQHFQQYIGSLCQAKCRSDFGDTGSGLEGGCRFALPAAVAGTVSAVTDRTTFSVSASGSFPAGTKGSLSGGYFAEGTVTFTSGVNSGLSKEVATSVSDGNWPLGTLSFVMKEPFGLDFQVGDTVLMQIGCDKTLAVCEANYNNVANFRGEPFVAGSDMLYHVNKG